MSAMESEFDTMARWTAEVVERLGPDYAIAAACRGSSNPGALRWLGDALGLGPPVRMLDDGAGLGGPAAFARQEYGVGPVLVDPMSGACASAAQLFGLPAVVATAQRLPFRDGAFDAAWCLGVLCTTEQKLPALRELRRVLREGGDVGLLVFLRHTDRLPVAPEGNDFPSEVELDGLLAATGFAVLDSVSADAFADPPPQWRAQVELVAQMLAEDHSRDARWKEVQRQQRPMEELLSGGLVSGRLIHARAERIVAAVLSAP